MEFTNALNDLWVAIFSQAGLVASLLFVAVIYQTWRLNRSDRKLEEKNNQVTSLAVSMIAANKDTQNVLDKIADIVARLK